MYSDDHYIEQCRRNGTKPDLELRVMNRCSANDTQCAPICTRTLWLAKLPLFLKSAPTHIKSSAPVNFENPFLRNHGVSEYNSDDILNHCRWDNNSIQAEVSVNRSNVFDIELLVSGFLYMEKDWIYVCIMVCSYYLELVHYGSVELHCYSDLPSPNRNYEVGTEAIAIK